MPFILILLIMYCALIRVNDLKTAERLMSLSDAIAQTIMVQRLIRRN